MIEYALIAVAVLLAFGLGVWIGKRQSAPHEAPATDVGYRVVQVCQSGAKARQLFERGQPGPGETLSLYDGSARRGHKEGGAA